MHSFGGNDYAERLHVCVCVYYGCMRILLRYIQKYGTSLDNDLIWNGEEGRTDGRTKVDLMCGFLLLHTEEVFYWMDWGWMRERMNFAWLLRGMERVNGMLCIWRALMASSGDGNDAISTSSPVLLILPPFMSRAPNSLSIWMEVEREERRERRRVRKEGRRLTK